MDKDEIKTRLPRWMRDENAEQKTTRWFLLGGRAVCYSRARPFRYERDKRPTDRPYEPVVRDSAGTAYVIRRSAGRPRVVAKTPSSTVKIDGRSYEFHPSTEGDRYLGALKSARGLWYVLVRDTRFDLKKEVSS